jgi:hypothetical protein
VVHNLLIENRSIRINDRLFFLNPANLTAATHFHKSRSPTFSEPSVGSRLANIEISIQNPIFQFSVHFERSAKAEIRAEHFERSAVVTNFIVEAAQPNYWLSS